MYTFEMLLQNSNKKGEKKKMRDKRLRCNKAVITKTTKSFTMIGSWGWGLSNHSFKATDFVLPSAESVYVITDDQDRKT